MLTDISTPGTWGLETAVLWPAGPDLVGREQELPAVEGRLLAPSARLISLTGPGGVGKSRLAAEASRAVSGEFPRGVRVVDVAACRTAGAAVAVVEQAVADLGGHGRGLLGLDGIEHRTRDLAPLITGLLALDAGLTVLATGQEALRVYGERVVPVGPLTPPGPLVGPEVADVQDNPAVLLFTRRAHEVDPGFTLTPENVDAVVDVCNVLEGVPLALELAATRLRLFPLAELRSWVRRGGDSHLTGPPGTPERQRSLSAVAEWSCRGLTPDQRYLLARLSIFEGATLATAEKVSPLSAAGTAEAIEVLLDRNLLRLAEPPRAEGRLMMPRIVRAWGRGVLEQDGVAGEAGESHARHFGELMRTIEGRFTGTEQQRWLRVAGLEHDNILTALAHFRSTGDLEAQAALLVACRRPWLIRGELRAGLELFDRTAAALAGDDSERALHLRARLCTGAGFLSSAAGDPDGAVHRHRRAVAIYRHLRDAQHGARASARLGRALIHSGDRETGQSLLAAARSTLEWLGDTTGSAEAAAGLAEASLDAGAFAEAGPLLQRAIGIYRQQGEIRGLAQTLLLGARLATLTGDRPAAYAAVRESLRLLDSIDDRTELPGALAAFALLTLDDAGQSQRAARLLAAADTMCRRAGMHRPRVLPDRFDTAVATLRRRLGPAVFPGVWADGVRAQPATTVAEALAVAEPSRVRERPEAESLTPRQLQVALNVAEGLTNRQIAEQLSIAEWTVVNHLRQVMRKLGCTSRVQVAWAVGRRQ
ncbi:hypothetical protein JIG36_50465 [Actinoplanes sp. LDG1-06]|uniref:HTH luxR-type domain-containing protein n=1 Tax=Paractinoplanes ovalisporus TaxID=2810368 RepID=A0ABS2AV36_9ACTN|nr:LuxR C-terminal-related transcriptional regulator [Actinoplanes ovalisporus]MBM2623743.1 hypothetical protein [Actinoplanes ovalisporus]